REMYRSDRRAVITALAAIQFSSIAAAFAPIFGIVLFVLSAAFGWWLFPLWIRRRRGVAATVGGLPASEVLLMVAPAFLAILLVASSWLPPEEITTVDHHHLLGYVLSADNGWYSI